MKNESEQLDFGSVVITSGEYEGQLGYYDNDEFDADLDRDLAVVYLDTPFQSEYILIEHESLKPITSLKHEKFKRENPEIVSRLGIR